MLIPVKLAGRCSNGYERDQGSKIHALNVTEPVSVFNPYYVKSLCGREPGRRSVGWVERFELVVTCPRCLKKMGHA